MRSVWQVEKHVTGGLESWLSRCECPGPRSPCLVPPSPEMGCTRERACFLTHLLLKGCGFQRLQQSASTCLGAPGASVS